MKPIPWTGKASHLTRGNAAEAGRIYVYARRKSGPRDSACVPASAGDASADAPSGSANTGTAKTSAWKRAADATDLSVCHRGGETDGEKERGRRAVSAVFHYVTGRAVDVNTRRARMMSETLVEPAGRTSNRDATEPSSDVNRR